MFFFYVRVGVCSPHVGLCRQGDAPIHYENGVVQGALADGWLLGAMACLKTGVHANHATCRYARNLIVAEYPEIGLYIVKVFKNGAWRYPSPYASPAVLF